MQHAVVARLGDAGASALEYGATEAEQALSSNFSPDAVKALSASADGMIGDLHGTPENRAHLVGLLTRRAVAAA